MKTHFRLPDLRSAAAAALMLLAMFTNRHVVVAAGSLDVPPGLSPDGLPTRGPAKDVGIVQRLGESLPLDAEFADEEGKTVRLGDYFHPGKPVVLILAYYECPMLCTQVLNGFLRSSQAIPLEIGKDYEVVTVSFDAREKPKLAAAKKKHYTKQYARPGGAQGWHFLTGGQSAIDELTSAAGFHYRWDEPSANFAHGSGIMVVTPEGKLSHYFYGFEFVPGDLKLALVDSSGGKIGSPVDQVLLLCFHYDPRLGRYGWAIANVIRASGILTVLVLGGFIFRSLRQERRALAAAQASEGQHLG